MEEILRTEKLSAGYGGKIIVGDMDIIAERGKILTLIGPNGAGKSTVLRTLIRQLDRISGSIAVLGRDIGSYGGKELARTMSILMTERSDPELITCRDVINSGRYPYTGQLGILSEEDRHQVDKAMELTAVTDIADNDLSRISDGQRQRVMLARAVAQEPEILILDEPTSYLDISHKLKLLDILKKLTRERGIAVIMSMHEIDLAQRISDSVICIKDGNIDRAGSPDEIFTADYISRLYGIDEGSYEELYGSAELSAVKSEPRYFVISGSGTGINIFRRLQRENIPFAAGVIHENDLDYPCGKALAAEIVTERAFEPISEEAQARARELINRCERVIYSGCRFGSMNEGNRLLLRYAESLGKVSGDLIPPLPPLLH
ncbi:MAG: ABC transporter ATP-binding protein [Oscillospiraceae bacterium]